MSTFRKKSTSTETSTSSSSETGSSTSSSCSGSSSSDSESSSSGDVKSVKATEGNANRTTRRKSSEFKTAAKAESEKHTPVQSSVKSRPTNGPCAQRQPPRSNTISSDDDGIPPQKKPVRSTSIVAGIQRRKMSTNSAAPPTQSQKSVGGKAPPASARLSQAAHAKTTSTKQHSFQGESLENNSRKEQSKSVLFPLTDDSDKDLPPSRNKIERKTQQKAGTTLHSAAIAARPKQSRPKPQPKRNTSSKVQNAQQKSSEESESESGKTASSSESEGSDSSNSYTSHPTKAIKGKRSSTVGKIQRSDSDNDDGGGIGMPVTPRKLTRSLSTRRNKQQLKHGTGAATDSDSDVAELDMEKRSLSKSPAKKAVIGGSSKCKVKKESGNMVTGGNGIMQPKPPSLSPPQQIEKKCPIEGCDSSGHLCGNLDKHFLPEACPIYHNMSASECKERANERKVRDEQRQKTGNKTVAAATVNSDSLAGSSRNLTTEQKDFLATIRESRQRFRPIAATISSDKVKMEKDCTDEDREPSLAGLVPDYDLQLFREAQAIASERIEDELKDLPVGKGIKYITMGKYKMKVWYQSPYPDDAARLPKMYICEFCLRYQKSETGIKRHAQKCVWRHPPGDEIYRKGKLQVWQVDGKRHKQYCQHLCLLAKFFLDHKTLYYDVEPFLFYIMTLADVDGCHTVGYFSKEKNSFYNVSCILTLPPYQRKGYGRLLIDFSYLLTRVEGKIGSPEKPLSDLGLISYRSYWKDVLLDYLCNRTGNTLSIKDVSQEMAIYSYDIVSTLQALGMMKYWKGKHIVLKKQDVLDEYEERVKRRGNFPKIDDSCLRWSPFVPTHKTDSP